MAANKYIRQISDPILHKPCKFADFNTDRAEIARQIELVIKCRKATGGIGIAANQCLEIENPLAIALVGIHPDDTLAKSRYKDIELPDQFILINPRIINLSQDRHKLAGGEGCLSVNGYLRGDIERHKTITISYFDEKGIAHENKTFTGMTAIIIQHELAHLLDGKVYLQTIIEQLTLEQKKQLIEIITLILQEKTHAMPQHEKPGERVRVFINNNNVICFDREQAIMGLKTLQADTLRGVLTQLN